MLHIPSPKHGQGPHHAVGRMAGSVGRCRLCWIMFFLNHWIMVSMQENMFSPGKSHSYLQYFVFFFRKLPCWNPGSRLNIARCIEHGPPIKFGGPNVDLSTDLPGSKLKDPRVLPVSRLHIYMRLPTFTYPTCDAKYVWQYSHEPVYYNSMI